MTLRSLLPRIALCLILIFNGIGAAMANAHMAQMEASGAGSTIPHAEMPAASGDDCGHGAEALPVPTHPMPHEDNECLQSCLAMCMQHCHAMPGLAVALILPDMRSAPVLPEANDVLPSPASPPVRPPIA